METSSFDFDFRHRRDRWPAREAWARRWLAEQWPEWAPRTRASAVEALARLVPLVTQADVSFDEPGEPKAGPRSVPIPRHPVELLRSWVNAGGYSGDDLLFQTRTGLRPTVLGKAKITLATPSKAG